MECIICKTKVDEESAKKSLENRFDVICSDRLCHAKYEGIPMPWDSGFGVAKTMELKESIESRRFSEI